MVFPQKRRKEIFLSKAVPIAVSRCAAAVAVQNAGSIRCVTVRGSEDSSSVVVVMENRHRNALAFNANPMKFAKRIAEETA